MEEAKVSDLRVCSRRMPKGDLQGNATIYKTKPTRITHKSLSTQEAVTLPKVLDPNRILYTNAIATRTLVHTLKKRGSDRVECRNTGFRANSDRKDNNVEQKCGSESWRGVLSPSSQHKGGCCDHARNTSSLKMSNMSTGRPANALCDRQPLVDIFINVLYTQVGSLGQRRLE
jgi:hypothetical protein